MSKLFRNTVYVRIKPDFLSVRHVETGNEHHDLPMLAIEQKGGKRLVVAAGHVAGAKARLPNVSLVNGFQHPRTLIADFTVAELTLKHFMGLVLPKSLFSTSPIIVIHPQALLDGGLTQIEIRAFAELGISAGARQAYVWEGPELSNEELKELRFSRSGGKLLQPPG
jgi:rod shape-determining protein MreB and related proteins